jgi:hypothetical protein
MVVRCMATLLLSVVSFAEVVDRVAVAIDKTVIPASEIIRQIRITALLNNETPDFTPSARRDAADRLVDQALIRREMQTSGYVSDPSDQGLVIYKAFRSRYPDDTAYNAALAKYDLTDQDVKDAFQWQATFLAFVEVRFRTGITVPEDELRDYYNDQKRKNDPAIGNLSFEDARPQIEQMLTQRRIDNALDRWLGQARTQTRIDYRKEAFE